MPEFALGMNAKLYGHATAATALSSMTEIDEVKDLTVNTSASLADLTTRANSGWRAQVPTLKELTIEFGVRWESDNAILNQMRDAYLNVTSFDLCALTGDKATGGNEGPRGTFYISEFGRDEPLEDGVMINVVATLFTYRAWEIVST